MPNHRKLHFLNFRSNKQVAGKDCNKQDAVPIRGSKYASLIPGCCSFANICVTYPSSPKFGGCFAVPDIYVSRCSCLEAGFLMKKFQTQGISNKGLPKGRSRNSEPFQRSPSMQGTFLIHRGRGWVTHSLGFTNLPPSPSKNPLALPSACWRN